jgi:hypothetical protein
MVLTMQTIPTADLMRLNMRELFWTIGKDPDGFDPGMTVITLGDSTCQTAIAIDEQNNLVLRTADSFF